MCEAHAAAHEHAARAAAAGESGRAFAVKGMTCEHCAASVTEEVEQVAGVTGVDVDVAGGTVFICGDFSDSAIRDAVEEAGYELVAA